MEINDKKKSFGILGGSFDPPHKGHLKISKISINRLKLFKLFWVITKRNPFKKKPFYSVEDRVKKSKKLTQNVKKIQEQKQRARMTIQAMYSSQETVRAQSHQLKINKNT